MRLTVLPPATTAVIKSIQAFSISISGGSSSNTATISSVDTSKAHIVFGGSSGGGSTEIRAALVDVVLTNATTVTATRSGATTNAVNVTGSVVEYY